MSLSYQPLQPVKVLDPRMILTNQRQYAVLQSGKSVMYKAFTSTSISSSSIQFSCPPPSGGVVVDRRQYITLPVRLTFTGDGGNSTNLIQPNKDAPRSFPFSSACDTLQVTINNTTVDINMADVIHPLLRFNTNDELKKFDYSTTPTYPDQSQNYSDLFGTNRNPLSFYGDQSDEAPPARGSFPFTVVSNSPTSAVVDMLITEPLFLSPFYWGQGNASGLYNVNTMDFNINFLNNAGMRMWSHDNSSGTNVITNVAVQFNNISNFSYAIGTPQLLFTYISPQDNELISSLQSITYPYFDIVRYTTDIGAIAYSSAQVGAGVTRSANNIQLSTIPRRMYLVVRPSNSELYGANGINMTDSFYGISNINIQFNNSLVLNSASQQQLYQLAVKNGCNMSWNQWSGYGMYPVGVVSGTKIGGCGSVVALEFGTDIPINSPYEAAGCNGQYNLYIEANIYNCDPSGAHDTVNASIYLIIVSEGSFTIPALGRSITQLGVLSKEDVLNARQQPGVSYHDVEAIKGGDFLSGLKNFGSNLLEGLRQIAPYVKQGLDIATKVAPLLAAGENERRLNNRAGVSVGGVPVGGRQLSREELRRRLKY